MKVRVLLGGIAAAFAMVLAGNQVFSQEKGEKGAASGMPADMQAAMEQYMKLGAPGEPHKEMAKRAGTWDAVVKSWWAGPDGPATESKGTSEVKVILDGRFVMEHFKCDMRMMGEQTMSFEGIGISGYDNPRNMYSSFWIDNMGTQMMTMLGSHVPGSNKLTYYGQADEPMLNVRDRTFKAVVTLVSDDKHVFEMFDLHVGDQHKIMEITYTRKK